MLYNQPYTVKELLKENAQMISYLVLLKKKKKIQALKRHKAYIEPSHVMALLCAEVTESQER